MGIDRSKLLERAENAKRESKYLDFKREFDIASPASWCEIVKDIVAFANSGGGVIVFGVNNDGAASGADVSALLGLDIADVTNKINRYTGFQFADL
jgi:predicted HTH transcriptional regulator